MFYVVKDKNYLFCYNMSNEVCMRLLKLDPMPPQIQIIFKIGKYFQQQRQGEPIVEIDCEKQKSKPDGISNVTENIVDRNLELTDPTPNIHDLFESLDAKYFAGLLSKNLVQLKWSTTIDAHDAGRCMYDESDETKSLITIELNERLLKYRTRRDLVETLLVTP